MHVSHLNGRSPAPLPFSGATGAVRTGSAARVTTASTHRRGLERVPERPRPYPSPSRARVSSAQPPAQPLHRPCGFPQRLSPAVAPCLARRPPPGNSAAAGTSSHWSLSSHLPASSVLRGPRLATSLCQSERSNPAGARAAHSWGGCCCRAPRRLVRLQAEQ